MKTAGDAPLLLLDLDYTAFDTGRFIGNFAPYVAAQAKLTTETFLSQIADYCVVAGNDLSHYSFSTHMEALGLDPLLAIEGVEAELAGQDYTYYDVTQVLPELIALGYEIQILTYGEARYQQAKLRCAPALGNLSAAIILEPKGPYIARSFPNRQGSIVDDKWIDNLPSGFQLLRIGRSIHANGGKFSRTFFEIQNSLSQLQAT